MCKKPRGEIICLWNNREIRVGVTYNFLSVRVRVRRVSLKVGPCLSSVW
jgi:hypothetical protein